MVPEHRARSRATFDRETINGAGQDSGWAELGRSSTVARRGPWEGLAEACSELSDTEWARPTECPGWDVKDQLSHLIGIEQMVMGQGPPEWDGPLGDHVKNDFAALNEKWIAVRRPEDGDAVLAEFGAVTAERLTTLRGLTDDDWAKVGFSPVGE